MPANEASWQDLQAVLGTRGPAFGCQCQRYKLPRRESFGSFPVEERAERLRGQTDCGHPDSERASGWVPATWCQRRARPGAGFTEVSNPTLRRVVMRIDF